MDVAGALADPMFSTELRDITNGAYFADRSTWAAIGYPGPRELQQAPQS